MFQDAPVLLRRGRFEDAARGYQSIPGAEPMHVDALVHLCALRLGQGLPAEARRVAKNGKNGLAGVA
jgi:hypothetical protein